MILNEAQIKEILAIIDRFHNSFVFNNITQDLPEQVISDLKQRGLIDPLADTDKFLKNAYELSRLKHLTEEKKDSIKTFEQLKRHLMTNPVPMTDSEVAAIEHLTATAKQYIEKHATWLKTAVDASVRNQNMALRHDLIGGQIKTAMARGVAERKGINQIVSTVRNLSPNSYVDFHRIVQTELQNALNVGQVDNIISRNRDKKSDAILVYKRPNPDACQYCKAAYLMPDGQTPRVFKLADLLSNGTNYGKKARDWKPVHEVMHPWCFLESNTQIFTNKGYKAIKDIKVGDMVLTHLGHFRPVVSIDASCPNNTYPANHDKYEITYIDNGHTNRVRVTPDHQLLTNLGWISAKDLNKETHSLMFAYRKCLRSECNNAVSLFKKSYPYNTDYCSVQCASSDKTTKQWKDSAIRQKMSNSMREIMNDRYKKDLTLGKKVTLKAHAKIKELIKNNQWKQNREHLKGDGNPAKRIEIRKKISDFAKSGHAAYACSCNAGKASKPQKELLDLVVSAMPQYSISENMTLSVSPKQWYVLDIAIPDIKLNIEYDGSYWHNKRREKDTLRDMQLIEKGWGVLRYEDRIPSKAELLGDVSRVLDNHDSNYSFNNGKILKIRKYTSKYKTRLWDFEVEEDHSFVANGIVSKNCQCKLFQLESNWGFQNGTLHYFGPRFDSSNLEQDADESRYNLMKETYDSSGNLKKSKCECCDSDVLAKAESGERVRGSTYIRREGTPGHYKYFYNEDFKNKMSNKDTLLDKMREAVKAHMEHHKKETISHDELHDIVSQLLEHKHMESKTPVSVLVATLKRDVEGAEKKGRGRPKKKEPDDYINAKPSEVSNIGEDVLGAARHNYSTYTLAELEENGMAEKAIAKKYLLSTWEDSFSNTPKEDKTKHLAKMYIHMLLPSKPKDDPAAREEYSEFVRFLQRQDDQSDSAETFLQSVGDYMKYRGRTSEDGTIVSMTGYKWINDFDQIKSFAWQSSWGSKRSRLAVQGYQMFTRLQLEDLKEKIVNGVTNQDERVKTMINALKEGPASYFAFATHTERRKGPTTAKYEEYIERNVSRKGGKTVRGNVKEMTNRFTKDMGVRAIQFGNSVTDDEREHHMKHTLEAFYDLADATGLDVADVAINGRLAMAFGARGKAGAIAHYEPKEQIINLTRASGVGTLAHEWGHFLDNVLQLQKEGEEKKFSGGFLSDNQGSTMKSVKDLPPEEKKRLFETLQPGDRLQFVQGYRKGNPVVGLFRYEPLANKAYPFVRENNGRRYSFYGSRNLMAIESRKSGDPLTDKMKEISGLMKDGLVKQMQEYDKKQKAAASGKPLTPYYYQVIEMFARSFESYVADKLTSMDRENTYLVARRKFDAEMGYADIYPKGELRKGLNKHFDELFKIIKETNALKKAIELLESK